MSPLMARILALHEAGRTYGEIAEILGCHPGYARAALRRQGLVPHGKRGLIWSYLTAPSPLARRLARPALQEGRFNMTWHVWTDEEGGSVYRGPIDNRCVVYRSRSVRRCEYVCDFLNSDFGHRLLGDKSSVASTFVRTDGAHLGP
jgi:hypothetical protein